MWWIEERRCEPPSNADTLKILEVSVGTELGVESEGVTILPR